MGVALLSLIEAEINANNMLANWGVDCSLRGYKQGLCCVCVEAPLDNIFNDYTSPVNHFESYDKHYKVCITRAVSWLTVARC